MDYLALYPRSQWTVSLILEDHAARKPGHPFLHFEGRDYTYRELNGHANRVARGLREVGVQSGGKVAVMMQSSPEYLSTWFALAKLGAVEVPVNTAYKGELLAHVLSHSDATTLIVDEEFVPVAAEIVSAVPSLATFVVHHRSPKITPMSALPGVVRSYADLSAGSDENLASPIAYTDLACIIYTSGTTGPSKGVLINHHHEVSFGVHFAEIMALTPSDVAYNYLPFFHIAAKFITIGSLLVDGRMILTPRLSIGGFWREMRRLNVTVFVAVGGVCHMLYGEPETEDDLRNAVRAVYAVPAPAEMYHDFERRFGLKLLEAYGATETNLIVYTAPDETPVGSCGRPSPHFEVKIVDGTDLETLPGVPGEIVVRSRYPYTLMEGYYKLPRKTLEAIRNFWFHTGDRAYRDADGRLFFLDRMKDAIRRRGENISSYEVERLVNQHPAVAESAAIPVPSELGEDEVKVVVVLKRDTILTHEELLRSCVERMPYFMVPRYFEFVEELPRTPTQKIKKYELRAAGENGITANTWDRDRAGLHVGRRGLAKSG